VVFSIKIVFFARSVVMMQREYLTRDKETYARLTAPQRVENNHYLEHKKVEGFRENKNISDFMSSDRLLRLDTIYGTIQLGYSLGKSRSFIFANIKTSIYDTISSRSQKVISEKGQIATQLKTGTMNRAISSRRRWGSAVMLYKSESQPWSLRSVASHLYRSNMETLRKTMPFLERGENISDRLWVIRQQRELQNDLRDNLQNQNIAEMAAIRVQQVELSTRQNMLNALLYRKDQQSRMFFRRLNLAIDTQKHEMFTYYRERRGGGGFVRSESVFEDNPNDKNEAEE